MRRWRWLPTLPRSFAMVRSRKTGWLLDGDVGSKIFGLGFIVLKIRGTALCSYRSDPVKRKLLKIQKKL